MENRETRHLKVGASTAERLGLGQLYSSRIAPTSGWSDMGGAEHFVQFYKDDSYIVNSIAEYVIHGLKSNETCFVVASGEHLIEIEAIINSFTNGLAIAESEGRYIPLDAAETLSQIMAGEMPDADRFLSVVGTKVAAAAATGRKVRIFGEMVGLLCAKENYAAAIRLEELWNELKKDHPFSLFCGYSMGVLDSGTASDHMSQICGTHSRVIPDETYTSLTSGDERLTAIAMLQQRSKQLEAEVAELERRISQRQMSLQPA